MVKYHINPEKGPLECNASIRDCKYTKNGDAHFNSKDEAQEAFEQRLQSRFNAMKSHNKRSKKDNSKNEPNYLFTDDLVSLDKQLAQDGVDLHNIIEYANSSKENYDKLDKLVDARAWKVMRNSETFQKLNPYSKKCVNPVSYGTYKKLKESLDNYKNETAVMVEGLHNSDNYVSQVEELEHDNTLGNTHIVTSYDHDDIRWHTSRFDAVGGSDVGILARQDFGTDNTKWDKRDYDELEHSKRVQITEEEALKSIELSEKSQKGPLYRGTMWEDRIRDSYAKDHTELKVYKTKDQFCSNDKDWMKVNFDGIVSDRDDGKPNGILEIKTGSRGEDWDNGVPLHYRAQTLYYLHATGFKFADIRVAINDGDVREFRLYANDEVAPNSGVTMKDYIDNKVSPWFENIKKERELVHS